MPRGPTVERARAELAERLRARREEIEVAVLDRVHSIANPLDVKDPVYLAGLRAAVSAALDYGLAGIEASDRRPPPAPTALLAQARLAARNGVGLDTVLRRYFAGHALLGDFLVAEAGDSKLLQGAPLKRLLRIQVSRFDRLLIAVSEEFGREVDSRARHSAEQQRAELIERLLAGEPLDTSELAYEVDGFHLAAILRGTGAREAARQLAATIDRRLLLVDRGESDIWFWLGGRRGFDEDELEQILAFAWPQGASLAIGEPGRGLPGWRLSHRQAKAALTIALRGGLKHVRYREVALLASALQDELLHTSLQRFYIMPLERERDGGAAAKETLRAYFDVDRNASSTAAALKVSRRTVTRRLSAIEKRLGQPARHWPLELELALRLDRLGTDQ